jgi:hypothetical protein
MVNIDWLVILLGHLFKKIFFETYGCEREMRQLYLQTGVKGPVWIWLIFELMEIIYANN